MPVGVNELIAGLGGGVTAAAGLFAKLRADRRHDKADAAQVRLDEFDKVRAEWKLLRDEVHADLEQCQKSNRALAESNHQLTVSNLSFENEVLRLRLDVAEVPGLRAEVARLREELQWHRINSGQMPEAEAAALADLIERRRQPSQSETPSRSATTGGDRE